MLRADATDTANSSMPIFTPSVRSIRFANIMDATPPNAPVPREKMMVATAGETYAEDVIAIFGILA